MVPIVFMSTTSYNESQGNSNDFLRGPMKKNANNDNLKGAFIDTNCIMELEWTVTKVDKILFWYTFDQI